MPPETVSLTALVLVLAGLDELDNYGVGFMSLHKDHEDDDDVGEEEAGLQVVLFVQVHEHEFKLTLGTVVQDCWQGGLLLDHPGGLGETDEILTSYSLDILILHVGDLSIDLEVSEEDISLELIWDSTSKQLFPLLVALLRGGVTEAFCEVTTTFKGRFVFVL